MSFDIIILKPSEASVTDLTEVEEVDTLGSFEAVSQIFNAAFPGCMDGGFLCGDDYSVELSLSGQPVESAHLTLRFGQSWDTQGEAHFEQQLTSTCGPSGWVAFAVSDNSRITP
ncbi:hypothetical protein GRF61_10340 [Azoarcus sp. TTM-91]|uniref:hypothetical protein n=1 Tax=Azoarcus sp. TTM-91 TaxID=2691581 RepID=UPI00145C6B19|nr:hypothetical protein [Azoarcus sp. TTM-91]NMG34839.1 hypothetical protein [Azoarcus sp. TTM-91]